MDDKKNKNIGGSMTIRTLLEDHLAAFWQKGYNAGYVKMDSLTPVAMGDDMAQFILSAMVQELEKKAHKHLLVDTKNKYVCFSDIIKLLE